MGVFPCIVLTPSEPWFVTVLLITVYYTDFVDLSLWLGCLLSCFCCLFSRVSGLRTGNVDLFIWEYDFMFQLTNGEYEILKSQIVTSNVLISQNATSNTSDNQKDAILKSQNATSSWGGTRKAPYAFTENGVAMLSVVTGSPLSYCCYSIQSTHWIPGIWLKCLVLCVTTVKP